MSLNIRHIEPEFIDERGFIAKLIDQDKYNLKTVLLIHRNKGSVGANHYHKKDAHYVYILNGKVKRYEAYILKNNSRITSKVLLPGDIIFTEPMVWHRDEFLEDSVIIAVTTENRMQKKYEKDTVRIDLLK